MPMKYYDENPKYNDNPEEIIEGEEIELKLSFCAICFGSIHCPILKGIWYHRDGEEDHEPVLADTLLQLFLNYENYGNGTRLKKDKNSSEDVLACPCYLNWYKLLKKDVEEGFYGEHYFDKNGMNLCKQFLISLTGEPIIDPEYPEKHGYKCEECIKVLVKKKIIRILPYEGKSTNLIYKRIEWLKKTNEKVVMIK